MAMRFQVVNEMVINVVPKTINGIQTPFVHKTHNRHLSNEKNPGWLVYIGGYTTQLYRDYNRPL